MMKEEREGIYAFPDSCRPILQDLLEKSKKTHGYPHVYVSFPSPGRMSIAVVARDWAGLLDIVTTYLHILDINLSLIVASLLYRDERISLSGIYIEAPLPQEIDPKELQTVLTQELPTIIESGEELREILLIGTRKLQVYQRIIRVLSNEMSEEEFQRFIRSREAVYFVHARSEAYLTERDPETLAYIVRTNWAFQEMLRQKKRGIFVDVHNLITHKKDQEEHLTGITVVGLDAEISLDSVMDVLREYDPFFRRKYDKEFISSDGIAVIRLEVTNREEKAYPPSLHPVIRRHLADGLQTMRRERRSSPPGGEVLARAIIPQLLHEAIRTGIPQMLLFPQLTERDFARYTLVVAMLSEDYRRHTPPLTTRLVERLNEIPDVHITTIPSPHIHKENGKEATYLSVELSVTGRMEDHETLYRTIQDILQELLKNVRNFDQGMREHDSRKLKEVLNNLRDREVNTQFIRRFFYTMDPYQRFLVSSELITEEILLAEDLLREYLQKDTPVIREQSVGDMVLIGIVWDKKNPPLTTLTQLVETYKFRMTSVPIYGVTVSILVGKISDPQPLRRTLEELRKKLQKSE